VTGLPDEVVRRLQAVVARHPEVRGLRLFGSRALHRHHGGSDVDLAVEGDLTLDQELRLGAELDALDLPWEIDLVCLTRLNDAGVRDHVARVGIDLYRSDGTVMVLGDIVAPATS
jgi:predicted nucleotidyltransferase